MEAPVGGSSHVVEVENYINNNLQFQYFEWGIVDISLLTTYKDEGFIIEQGLPAVPEVFKDLAIAICDLALLIFIDMPISLIYWDSDYLCARTFLLIRDGEAFLGHSLLAMGFELGSSFVLDALSHRTAYDDFLKHKIQTAGNENLNSDGSKPVVSGSAATEIKSADEILEGIHDDASYEAVQFTCFQDKNYDLLFKATAKYATLEEKGLELDKIYFNIANFCRTNRQISDAFSAVRMISSSDKKDEALISLINSTLYHLHFSIGFAAACELSSKEKEKYLMLVAQGSSFICEYEIALKALSEMGVIDIPARDLILQIADQCFSESKLNHLTPKVLMVMCRLDIEDDAVNNWCVNTLRNCFTNIYHANQAEEDSHLLGQENKKIENVIDYYFTMLSRSNFKKHSTDLLCNTHGIERRVKEIVNENQYDYTSQIRASFETSTLRECLTALKTDFEEKCQQKWGESAGII